LSSLFVFALFIKDAAFINDDVRIFLTAYIVSNITLS
jgi:hypothetical protein